MLNTHKTRSFPRFAAWTALPAVMILAGLLLYFAFGHFYRTAYPIHFSPLVLAECERNDLPPALVYAVIRTESGFDPDAQSSVPARGLMQITQDTFEWTQYRIGETDALHFDDLFDSELNIRYGAALLRLLLDEFGSERNALCAYHAGWGKAKEWLADPRYAPGGDEILEIPYGDTRRYVGKVMATKETYQALYDLSE